MQFLQPQGLIIHETKLAFLDSKNVGSLGSWILDVSARIQHSFIPSKIISQCMLVQPLRQTTKVLRIHEWWAFMASLFANEIDKIREESQS